MSQGNVQTVEAAFRSSVNRNGYGFHHSLMRFVRSLAREGVSRWCEPIVEFPVEVQGSGTKIDLILSYQRSGLYLIGECKRVNPALGAWCFASRGSEERLSDRERQYYIEVMEGDKKRSTSLRELTRTNVFQVGLKVKTGEKGAGKGSGRGAIEEACTQVLRGMNGLMDLFDQRPEIWDEAKRVAFVPAIFTTAELFVSKADLADADLKTGNLTESQVELSPVDWLVYHYPQSARMQHSIELSPESSWERRELSGILYEEYVRPIAIVSVAGIKGFLSWTQWSHFTRMRQFRV